MLICKICNYSSNQLHQHLKSTHNMPSLEYRAIYGSTEIMQVGFAPPNGRIKKQVDNGYTIIRETLNSINDIYSNLLRQTEIKNYLGCKFIRIRYANK